MTNHISQKERIIEQAKQMFVQQGIKAVRMDDIAQQLGVSKRTLYELFEDKEGLLYLALNRYVEEREARQAELMAGAENMLEALFRALSDVMDNSETVNRMMSNLKKFYPAVHAKLTAEGAEKHRLGLRTCLEKGIEDKVFIRNMNVDLAVSILYYTASALVIRKDLILPAGMSEREAFLQIVTTFFRGIATAKGLALIDTYAARHHSGGGGNVK